MIFSGNIAFLYSQFPILVQPRWLGLGTKPTWSGSGKGCWLTANKQKSSQTKIVLRLLYIQNVVPHIVAIALKCRAFLAACTSKNNETLGYWTETRLKNTLDKCSVNIYHLQMWHSGHKLFFRLVLNSQLSTSHLTMLN